MQTREDGNPEHAKIDRALSNLSNADVQTAIVVKSTFNVQTVTNNTGSVIDFLNIRSSDEFTTMAQQFMMYKVKWIKFQVYPQLAANTVPMSISTFHGNYFGSVPVAWVTESSVIDGVDSEYLPIGGRPISFYWIAKGEPENSWLPEDSTQSFGGLRYFQPGTQVSGIQCRVNMSAMVTFKGRE